MKKNLTLVAHAAVLIAAAATANADAFSTTVSAQANLFGAGSAVPPAPQGGGGGVLPPLAVSALMSGSWIEIDSAIGEVRAGPDPVPFNGADGGTSFGGTTDVTSWQGISGLIHDDRTLFLAGVFLSDLAPQDPAPARRDDTNANAQSDFFPALNQTFFIGDGLTDSLQTQRFFAPADATRFYLGFIDGSLFQSPPGFYGDNEGDIEVEFRVVPGPGSVALIVVGAPLLNRRRR